MKAKLSWVVIILTGILFSGCATEGTQVSARELSQRQHIGGLSFVPPGGGGWRQFRDEIPPAELVMFLRHGSSTAYGDTVTVGRFQTDQAVTSKEELLKFVVAPFRDAIDTQEHFRMVSNECEHDERFGKVGVFCAIEGRHRLRAHPTAFWGEGVTRGDEVTVKGYGYAFVHPEDNRMVFIIDYFRLGASERLTADTKQLLSEFADNVELLR